VPQYAPFDLYIEDVFELLLGIDSVQTKDKLPFLSSLDNNNWLVAIYALPFWILESTSPHNVIGSVDC